MIYLPYACIPVLVLIVVSTLIVTGRMTGRVTRLYFRAVRRFCEQQGFTVADDPERWERIMITGVLDDVRLRVSTGTMSVSGTADAGSGNPTQRVELEAGDPQSWVMHPPLDRRFKEHITSPRLPEVEPLVATGDTEFDSKLELRAAGGRPPAFIQVAWLRRVLLECHICLGFSHEGRTLIDFEERALHDADFDLHLLRRRVLASLASIDTERAERHREQLLEPPPGRGVNWSAVPLLAMFLTLGAAGVGDLVLAFRERWMDAVVGATAGYPVVLLLVLGASLWIRRIRSRGGEGNSGQGT